LPPSSIITPNTSVATETTTPTRSSTSTREQIDETSKATAQCDIEKAMEILKGCLVGRLPRDSTNEDKVVIDVVHDGT
jgi:hypothetical protein